MISSRLSHSLSRNLARTVMMPKSLTGISLLTMAALWSSSTTTRTSAFSTQLQGSGGRLEKWQKRWQMGNTRWHRSDVHPSLAKYFDSRILQDKFPMGGARILVPLCGKTVDMAHLALKRKVNEVVGVDGVPQALQEFIEENPDLEIQETNQGIGIWKGFSTTLINADFFELDLVTAGGTFDGAWDRGALVAIEPRLRAAYVQQLGTLVSGTILLSTYVRPNGDTSTGPPFSIDEAEVRRLFDQPWVESIQVLEEHSALAMEPWYKAIAMYFRLGNVTEKIFLITTKSR